MCGRFTLMLEPEELLAEYGLDQVPEGYQPRFNIAPSQPVAVLTDLDSRKAEWMRWGLIPSWAKDPAIGSRMINARSETLTEKPSFRVPFARRRCLILADGFYEWQKAAKGSSQPFHFRRPNRQPFAFAGLWEYWRSPDGAEVKSCTIITTSANAVVAPVHERMPVMLDRLTFPAWLGEHSLDDLAKLLLPFPAEELQSLAVGRGVNTPDRDDPGLLLPLENTDRLF